MISILTAALLATNALATPLGLHPNPDTSNVTLQARGAPVGQGQDSGISISIYEGAGCKGVSITGQEMNYATNYSGQLQSYSLSDDLGPDDTLKFYADSQWTFGGSKPVDVTLNDDPDKACVVYAYVASGKAAKSGCHTLPNVVGCVSIWAS